MDQKGETNRCLQSAITQNQSVQAKRFSDEKQAHSFNDDKCSPASATRKPEKLSIDNFRDSESDESAMAMLEDATNKNSKNEKLVESNWETDLPPRVPLYKSMRLVIAIILSLSLITNSMPRSALPLALMCMVNSRISLTNGVFSTQLLQNDATIPLNSTVNSSLINEHRLDQGQFNSSNQLELDYSPTNRSQEEKGTTGHDLSPEMIGLILSSAYFLTFLGPLVVERLRHCVGSKLALAFIQFISILSSCLIPTAARSSPYALIPIVALNGFCAMASSPVSGDALAWWAPLQDKLTLVTIEFSGLPIAAGITILASGLFCGVAVDDGWPLVFYFCGTASFLCALMWLIFGSRTPEENRFICERERSYITATRAKIGQKERTIKERPPYLKMFTSVPVLVFLFVGVAHVWCTVTFINYIPIFLNRGLNFSVEETGLLVLGLVFCRTGGGFAWAALHNFIIARKIIKPGKAKKVCVCGGLVASSALLLSMVLLQNEHRWAKYIMSDILLALQAVDGISVRALPLDLAPRYAGFLTACVSSLSALFCITGPLVAARLTRGNTHEEWVSLFGLISCVFCSMAFVFLVFGRTSLQSWAR